MIFAPMWNSETHMTKYNMGKKIMFKDEDHALVEGCNTVEKSRSLCQVQLLLQIIWMYDHIWLEIRKFDSLNKFVQHRKVVPRTFWCLKDETQINFFDKMVSNYTDDDTLSISVDFTLMWKKRRKKACLKHWHIWVQK